MSKSLENPNLSAPEIKQLVHRPIGTTAASHLLEVAPIGEAPTFLQLHTNEVAPTGVIETPHGILESRYAAGSEAESGWLFHDELSSRLDRARVLNGQWRTESISDSREATAPVLAFIVAAQEGKTSYVPTLEDKVTALERMEHAYQHTVGERRFSDATDTALGSDYTSRTVGEAEVATAVQEGDDAIAASLFEVTDSGRILGMPSEEAAELVKSDGQAALDLLRHTTNPTDQQVGAVRIWKWAMKHKQFDTAAQTVAFVSDPEVATLLGAELEEAQELDNAGLTPEKKIVVDLQESSRKQLATVIARENERIEKAGGVPIDAEQLKERADTLDATAEIHTRIGSSEFIEMIMRNGRQRSVLETGMSGSDDGRIASYDPAHSRRRREHEDALWSNGRHGLGDISYGVLELPSEHDGPIKFAEAYGGVDVALKADQVKGRTTFTYGDSASGPQWATRESLMAWDDAIEAGVILDRTAELGIQSESYVEAQIVGGIETGDIESVTMPLGELSKAIPNDEADGDRQKTLAAKLPEAISLVCGRLKDVSVTFTVDRRNLRYLFDGKAAPIQSALDQNPNLKIVVIDSQEEVEVLAAKSVHPRLVTQVRS